MSEQPYRIAWTPTARRALRRLPEKVAAAVIEVVYGPLAASPRRVGKPLRFELEELYGARRGDFRIVYRIVYRIADEVSIVAI